MTSFWYLFNLIGVILLWPLSLYCFARFLRWRTLYNAGMLAISVVLLVDTAVGLVVPGRLVSVTAAVLSLLVGETYSRVLASLVRIIVILLIIAFTFYPDIRRFAAGRRKMR